MQIFSIKNGICFWHFRNLQGADFKISKNKSQKSEKKMHETGSVSIFGGSGKKVLTAVSANKKMKRATFDTHPKKKLLLSFIGQNEKHNGLKIFSKKSENNTENKNDTQEQLFLMKKTTKIHHTYIAVFIFNLFYNLH